MLTVLLAHEEPAVFFGPLALGEDVLLVGLTRCEDEVFGEVGLYLAGGHPAHQ